MDVPLISTAWLTCGPGLAGPWCSVWLDVVPLCTGQQLPQSPVTAVQFGPNPWGPFSSGSSAVDAEMSALAEDIAAADMQEAPGGQRLKENIDRMRARCAQHRQAGPATWF